jgi:branched-chain amino acid transport system permease protein
MNKKRLGVIAGVLILALFPILSHSQYIAHILISIFISSIVALGVGLLLYAGMISLGQAGIMAIGAYSSALLVMNGGLSFWLALPAASVLTTLIGLLFGLPVFKLKGLYFFLVTWAIGSLITLTILYLPSTIFGGHAGITGVPLPDAIPLPWGGAIEFVGKTSFYYLTLVFLLAVSFVSHRLYKAHFGNVLFMISKNEDLARSIGVNVARYKAVIWVIACLFAGIGGSLQVHYYQLATTQLFSATNSIYFIMMPTLGGCNTIFGSIMGAAFFVAVPEIFRDVALYAPIIFGVVVIFTVFVLPGGLETFPQRMAKSRLAKRLLACGVNDKGGHGRGTP